MNPMESLKRVATPCIDDHQIPLEEFAVKGELSPIAARVVLKALHVARIARMDLMWSVNMLAREVTRWTAACDRIISWMHHSSDYIFSTKRLSASLTQERTQHSSADMAA